MIEPIFQWDPDSGNASCILSDGYNTFYGSAICHNADADMKNEQTGLEIAYRRARIKALIYQRDCDLKPALAAYKQLFYSMNTSKKFNPKSYENKMLQRKIKEKELDIETINEILQNERQSLKQYLEDKEKLYNKIRKNRQAKNN